MQTLKRVLTAVAEAFDHIAMWGILVMMLLTTADVVLRFFRHPIPGTYEIVGFIGALVISLSLAKTSMEKGHIAVEFLVQKLSLRAQLAVDVINGWIATLLFALTAYQLLIYALDTRMSGLVSATLQIPIYPFVFGTAAGALALALWLLLETTDATLALISVK